MQSTTHAARPLRLRSGPLQISNHTPLKPPIAWPKSTPPRTVRRAVRSTSAAAAHAPPQHAFAAPCRRSTGHRPRKADELAASVAWASEAAALPSEPTRCHRTCDNSCFARHRSKACQSGSWDRSPHSDASSCSQRDFSAGFLEAGAALATPPASMNDPPTPPSSPCTASPPASVPSAPPHPASQADIHTGAKCASPAL